MDEFAKFHQLRDGGLDAVAVYRLAVADGHADVFAIRMLRAVFGLTLTGAKEVTLQGVSPGATVESHQERLAEAVLAALGGSGVYP